MFAITFAIVGGFAWGRLTDLWGPKRTLNVVLLAWVGIFVLAAAVGLAGLPMPFMYVMAALAGFSLGGVWAADRPFMLRLAPPWRIGEFYGLYGMVGRFSAITGPLVWAVSTSVATRWIKAANPDAASAVVARTAQGAGVLVLLCLMLAGFFILQKVDDRPRPWARPGN
jgi:UMF1 family MFS transporter